MAKGAPKQRLWAKREDEDENEDEEELFSHGPY
jgi:hypothetical protein